MRFWYSGRWPPVPARVNEKWLGAGPLPRDVLGEQRTARRRAQWLGCVPRLCHLLGPGRRPDVDYVEARDDMELAQLGSSGVSCGGMLGGLLPAVESRLKVAAPVVASLDFGRPLPEADPFTFFPRITILVLMLNGRLDLFFRPEASQATQAPAQLRRGTSGSSLAAPKENAGLVRRVPGSGANHEQSGLVHQLTRRRVVHRPVVRSALRARAVRTRSARSTHRASICFSKRFVRRAPRCCAFTKAVEGRALCLAHRGEF